jgi:PEP phosphonomutase and related enzymes
MIAEKAEACGSAAGNIMAMNRTPPIARMAELGVARVSYGPGPYRKAMAAITEAARPLYADA